MVDTEAPTITLKQGETEISKDEFIVDMTANNEYTLEQLKDNLLATIIATYADNYTSNDYLLAHASRSCVDLEAIDTTKKYITTYRCTYTVSDEAKNSTNKEILIHIRDLYDPIIVGEETTTYITSNQVTFEMPTCTDNYAAGGCTRYYKVNGGEAIRYTRSVVIDNLLEGTNTIEYYAIDAVINDSNHYTLTYIVDTIHPSIDIVLSNKVLDDYTTCGLYGSENVCTLKDESTYILKNNEYTFLHLEIDDENLSATQLYKFDGTVYNVVTLKDIEESGLYKIVVRDLAGNETSKEFYVYKEVYDEATNAKKINVMSASGEEFETDCENGWAVVTVCGCTLGGVKVVSG